MRAMTDGKQGGLAQTFTPRVVDMIVAEIVDSYRKQLEPPSKAVQWGKRLTYRQPDSADISVKGCAVSALAKASQGTLGGNLYTPVNLPNKHA